MKTVAQWAEQLPELIKIEFLKECETHQLNLKRKREDLSGVFWLSFWWLESYTELGSEFWQFVRNELNDDPTSADYLDETIPYTKEEVDAMILEFADPNDEVCQVMLANIAKPREVKSCSQIIDIQQNEPCYLFPMREGENLQQFAKRIEQENEALKSTIQGLNAIVETQKAEIAELKTRMDELNQQFYPLNRELNSAKYDLSNEKKHTERLENRIKELEQTPKKYGVPKMENPPQCPPLNPSEYATMPKGLTPQPKTSLFQRFLNLFK